MKIADLHCDLLSYLAHKETRNPRDPECRASFPQLKKGKVALQTLAVFTETGKKAVRNAEKQFTIFQTLPKLYPSDCIHLKELYPPDKGDEKVYLIIAIENMSGLLGEKEDFENCFSRFDQYRKVASPILYVSLTWHHENRFGGGDMSKVGLKREGELVLDYLDRANIAIDLSHTSDALAEDILNYIDKKGLHLIPIASHSNFRAVKDHARNLNDTIAKEIIRRKGIIGLNFVKQFTGKKCPKDFMRHVDHAAALGALDHYCFGADFFYDKDPPMSLNPFFPFFYDRFGDASCYPDLLEYLTKNYSESELEKLAYQNFANFLQKHRAKR